MLASSDSSPSSCGSSPAEPPLPYSRLHRLHRSRRQKTGKWGMVELKPVRADLNLFQLLRFCLKAVETGLNYLVCIDYLQLGSYWYESGETSFLRLDVNCILSSLIFFIDVSLYTGHFTHCIIICKCVVLCTFYANTIIFLYLDRYIPN